jgi:hypothetical protein
MADFQTNMTDPRVSSRMFRLLLGVVVCIHVSVALFIASSRGPDDHYITYWPAWTLKTFGKIYNYNLESVEQSSSLFYTVLLSFLSWLIGPESSMVNLSCSVGIVMSALTVVVACIIARRWTGKWWLVTAVAIAFNPSFLHWSVSGMETTTSAFAGSLVMLGATVSRGRNTNFIKYTALSLGILIWTLSRPEGGLILMFAALMVFCFLRLKPNAQLDPQLRSDAFFVLCLAGMIFTLVTTWRLATFGLAFPLPVYAKAAVTDRSVMEHFDIAWRGLYYVFYSSRLLTLYWALMFMAWWLVPSQSTAKFVLPFALTAAQMLFAIVVGGDWMMEWRFIMPTVALVMIAPSLVFLYGPRFAKVIGSILVLMAIGKSLSVIGSFREDRQQNLHATEALVKKLGGKIDDVSWFDRFRSTSLRDREAADAMFKIVEQILHLSNQPVVIASGQAGYVMYHVAQRFIGQIYFIDRVGLTTQHVLNHRIKRAQGIVSPNLNHNDFPIHRHMLLDPDQSTLIVREAPDIIFDYGRAPGPIDNYHLVFEQLPNPQHIYVHARHQMKSVP